MCLKFKPANLDETICFIVSLVGVDTTSESTRVHVAVENLPINIACVAFISEHQLSIGITKAGFFFCVDCGHRSISKTKNHAPKIRGLRFVVLVAFRRCIIC